MLILNLELGSVECNGEALKTKGQDITIIMFADDGTDISVEYGLQGIKVKWSHQTDHFRSISSEGVLWNSGK